MTALPNLLTLSRIAAIPLVVGLLWLDAPAGAVACRRSVRRRLHHRLVRRLFRRAAAQISRLGRFLDPIADKLLVAAALLMLVDERPLSGLDRAAGADHPGREILVSGLREFLAELRVGVPVSQLAKWKTALQMVALGFLLVGDGGAARLAHRPVGEIGLWVAAALTLITGYDYLKAGLKHM